MQQQGKHRVPHRHKGVFAMTLASLFLEYCIEL